MNNASIILASQSVARTRMLEAAGINFTSMPAHIEEQKIMQEMLDKASPQEQKTTEYIAQIALELAAQKAQHVSKSHSDLTLDKLVIGSDQILECEGEIFSKADSADEAKENLKKLRGKTHRLLSAVVVFKNNKNIWQHYEYAELTMHDFDDEYLQNYIDKAGIALTRAVGGYELETLGSWLFEDIQGDYFTILGMPLLALLTMLQKNEGYSWEKIK